MSLSRLLPVSCYGVRELEKVDALAFTLIFETARFGGRRMGHLGGTYLAPPPSAVAGMVGAILGVMRGNLGDFACEKGLLTGAALLGYQGRVEDAMVLRELEGGGRSRSVERISLLYRPTYRVAVASPDDDLIGELEGRIGRLDFDYGLFGGNDYNFLAWIGDLKRGRLVRTRRGIGYCRLSDLMGFEGDGSIQIDEVRGDEAVSYAFGHGVVLRLARDHLAVDDGGERILVHESWRFLR